MSRRLVDASARFLEARTSRRGFLRRAAIVGSALVAAPAAYVLRPGTAYSALLTTCSECGGGARCCDGYTEFCCTLTGVNTCPPGSIVAGWWRAEYPGSGTEFCGGGSRYYMDCNSADCGGCGCGASGTCSHTCTGCDCACANGECSNRRACCTRFRYGQCNQEVACVGPIVCRVVTCVPPWEWDSTCTHTDAVDSATYRHDAACLHPTLDYPARPAVVSGTTWAMRSVLTSGPATEVVEYGQPGDVPLMADWTGAGIATPAVVRGVRRGPAGDTALTWHVRQGEGEGTPDLVFEYGRAGDIPVVGDWDGDGVATPGVVRDGRWLLRNSNSSGGPDIELTFGQAGDTPVVGRWTDAGIDLPGMVRGTTWLLKTRLAGGSPDVTFEFGPGGLPVTGDWTGAGRDGPGWFDSGAWYYRTSLTSGSATGSFQFGEGGGRPVVWGRVP